MAYTLTCELGDAAFDVPLRYFVTLTLLGGAGDGNTAQQERTDVVTAPTTEPVFRTRSFTFSIPEAGDPDQWSLVLGAVAFVNADEGAADAPDASAASATKPQRREVCEGTMRLDGSLIESGAVEQRVTLLEPADGPNPGQPAGNILVKLRLAPSPPPPPAAPRVPSGRGGVSSAARRTSGGGEQFSVELDRKEREVVQLQELVSQLKDEAGAKTHKLANEEQEVMLLRGINQRLEAELGKVRAHVEESARHMEQLASDATNVENIDLPQLQSRHRMLGAAYRADRRQMEQLKSELSQRTAALGTQEQLAKSYAQLKSAHRSQGEQMQRLQEEARKVDKYRQTCKQQDSIIQRLEGLLAAALRDSKKLKALEPQHEALKKQMAGAVQELEHQKSENARIEAEAKENVKKLKEAMEGGAIEEAPKKGDDDEEGEPMMRVGAFASEDGVKLRMRAEKAERRAAALEDEMQEMARQNGKEVAKLKMRLAEAQASATHGNLLLGEVTPPGSAGALSSVGLPDVTDGGLGGGGLAKAPPLGSSRRATPPPNKRLDPLGGAPAGGE